MEQLDRSDVSATVVGDRLMRLHDRLSAALPANEAQARGDMSSTSWPAWQEWINGPPWRNGPG